MIAVDTLGEDMQQKKAAVAENELFVGSEYETVEIAGIAWQRILSADNLSGVLLAENGDGTVIGLMFSGYVYDQLQPLLDTIVIH